MKRLCCTAQIVAVVLLSGCGTAEVFGRYDLPESESVADAPWPRLADTPAAPAPGAYSAAVPDPARGEALLRDLGAEAVAADARAGVLAGPVIPTAEKDAMLRRAKRKR